MGPSGTGNTSADGPAVSGEKIEHGTSLVSDGEGPFFRGKDRLFKRQPQRVGDRGVAHKATAKWLSSRWFPARTVSTSDWKRVAGISKGVAPRAKRGGHRFPAGAGRPTKQASPRFSTVASGCHHCMQLRTSFARAWASSRASGEITAAESVVTIGDIVTV